MSLDQDIQIRDLDDLVGHTIKAVIQSPAGKRQVDVVIVTETGCWLALSAEGGSFDEAPTIETHPTYYGGFDIPLSEYLSAGDALHNGLINQATYELMREREAQERDAEKKTKLDRLRKQIADLEGGSA
jgi:hypothetical protein